MKLRYLLGAAAALGLAGFTASAAMAADAANGEALFKQKCQVCHSLVAGKQGIGPSLAGVIGRTAGTLDGFPRYSKALTGSGIVWDAAALDTWLADTKAAVPGSQMPFGPIRDAATRADIIAFLESQ